MPGLTLGDGLPDVQVETTHGNFRLHDYIQGSSWLILFSHPGASLEGLKWRTDKVEDPEVIWYMVEVRNLNFVNYIYEVVKEIKVKKYEVELECDFTPVCTTELGMMASYADKFEERGAKLLGLSCDDLNSHNQWIKDIEAFNNGCKVKYPIIADPKRELIKQLNMVDPDEKDDQGNQLPSRALHIVDSNNKIKLSFLYPGSTGRNLDEVLRVLDSLNKASKHKVASPANWKPGEPVVISPSVSNEDAHKLFPQGYKSVDLPSKKDYLRFTNV